MVVNVLLRLLLLLLSAVVIVDVSGDGLAAVVVDDVIVWLLLLLCCYLYHCWYYFSLFYLLDVAAVIVVDVRILFFILHRWVLMLQVIVGTWCEYVWKRSLLWKLMIFLLADDNLKWRRPFESKSNRSVVDFFSPTFLSTRLISHPIARCSRCRSWAPFVTFVIVWRNPSDRT